MNPFGSSFMDEYLSPVIMYSNTCTSKLSISGNSATCISSVTGYYEVTTKIVIEQTLEKKVSATGWSAVKSWSKTIESYNATANNVYSNLPSGTYRLVTTFKVFSYDNYEVFSKLSSNITI